MGSSDAGAPSPPADAEIAWRAAVAEVLKARGGWFAPDVTDDGIAVHPLYAAHPAPALQPSRTPGAFVTVQRLDDPDLDRGRALALADLEGGAAGLTLVFAGARSARGFGCPVHDVEQLDRLLADVDLSRVAIRCEGAPAALDVGACFAALARRRPLDIASLDIDAGLDPFSDEARRGEAGSSRADQATALARAFGEWRGHGFGSPLLRVDARPFHEAGATEAQELASVLATAVACLRLLDGAGVSLDEAAGAVSYLLVADVDLVVTVAKFRAFRRLWARVAEACGLDQRPVRLHAETSWRALTRRDPWTNILRGTLGCAGAMLGGADSITVLPFTSALGLPDASVRRLARNTALILAEESQFLRVIDPVAGAGAFESLTEALCETAWSLFQGIESQGGFPNALASGYWPSLIATARERRRHDLAQGKRTLIGTSAFPDLGEVLPGVLAPAPLDAAADAADLPALPSTRDATPFERLLDRSDAWLARHGRRPRVVVSASCPDVARDALATGGFEIMLGDETSGTAAVESRFTAGCDLLAALESIWTDISQP